MLCWGRPFSHACWLATLKRQQADTSFRCTSCCCRISIDCSFSANSSLANSIQRLLVQMLFPFIALAAGVLGWLIYFGIQRARRRLLTRMRFYLPHRLVLTSVLVLFYL